MYLDELRTLLVRHARPDWTTVIDGVLISRVERSDPPSLSMSGTVLAVIAQGAKHLALGERVYEYRAGQYLVTSVDLPVTGHFVDASPQHPALGFGLTWSPPPSLNCCCRPDPETSPAPAAARRRASPSVMLRMRCSTR